MKRRVFLAGAAAIAAVPAAVVIAKEVTAAPAALTHAHVPPSIVVAPAVLSGHELAQEFARLLYEFGGRASSSPSLPLSAIQSHISFPYIEAQRRMSLEEYSSQLLAPAAREMMENMVRKGVFLAAPPIPQPRLFEKALASYGGIEARFVADYEMISDMVLQRFDVRHTA